MVATVAGGTPSRAGIPTAARGRQGITMNTPTKLDPLWMLYIFYFVPCELMFRHHRRLKQSYYGDDESVFYEFRAYTSYWFAALFVVAEGWKTLNITDAEIDEMVKQEENLTSLRLFRNAVYHFQRKPDRKS